MSGATYQWGNKDGALRLFCGGGNISHAGFTSPYNTSGGCLKWGYTYVDPTTGATVTLPGWYPDPNCPLQAQWPPTDEIGVITCNVTYNGEAYYFYKKVFISGY